MSLPSFDALPETLRGVRTRPLFVMQLAVKPIQVIGATPAGVRRVGVVTGGSFAGERLAGEVLDGSDWQLAHAGSVSLDVRVVLKTRSGAQIGLFYRGYRHGPPEVLARVDRGEAVAPADYYFRTQAWFEAGPGEFEWLNRVLAVGIGERRADGPVYSLFEIL
jgi:hypothetical protein